MHLELSDQELSWQTEWRNFATEVLAPASEEMDRTARLPDHLLASLRDRRILQPFLPVELGGQGLELFHLTLLVEELGRQSPVVAWLAAQQVVIGIRTNLACFNVPDHRDLARQAANLEAICSLAATEPEAGCDLGALTTTSRRRDDGQYEVSGGKAYVNWAGRARWLVTLTKAEGEGGQGSTMLLIRLPSPQVKIGEVHATLGMNGLEAAPVVFERQVVPASHVAGVAGFGHDLYDRMVNELRICVAAIATGLGQQVFDDAAHHAKSRKQFGRPIGSFQSLQWRFSDAALKVDAARLHVWQAVELAGAKGSCFQQAAMAKIFATEAAFWVADFGMQAMGSKAYVRPSRVERLFRDARFLKIALGTSEILRNKIAERL
ncbi:MAG: Butyryl-CoA dehydrogenase [Candidatus Ozemobacter sibiricus]|uniref:Butyryl-CoA dehydrogenase n=1 Tax=Candidatus Ozemobacter sibiricus TaxID=2268124 RepID=A0A367ZWM4_9BACT|nr:MAG: Butyryl-CoA dehydrogenase [Candidatus Ozemobacter sibiricus]